MNTFLEIFIRLSFLALFIFMIHPIKKDTVINSILNGSIAIAFWLFYERSMYNKDKRNK